MTSKIFEYIGIASASLFVVWLVWPLVAILYRAAKDTFVTIQNSREEKLEWYWYLLTPLQFCQDVWRQAVASWYGYETWTVRNRK